MILKKFNIIFNKKVRNKIIAILDLVLGLGKKNKQFLTKVSQFHHMVHKLGHHPIPIQEEARVYHALAMQLSNYSVLRYLYLSICSIPSVMALYHLITPGDTMGAGGNDISPARRNDQNIDPVVVEEEEEEEEYTRN